MDLPLLIDGTFEVAKTSTAIAAIENCRIDYIFYPYRPHREDSTTRFGSLFYNDKIVIPEAMRSSIIAMLHRGHVAVSKMDQEAETFWWLGLRRKIREKSKNCPSCRAADKNLRTQITRTDLNKLELLSEPNQEIQLDLASPIPSGTRGDVCNLVAVDRFSKWPTAHICKNTDTRTVSKFLAKYCSDNRTPWTIRTNYGSCFKSDEFKEFCDSEQVQCTPNLHTVTQQKERTIRTIRSLTRANLRDGLISEGSVQLAIKTIK